MRGTVDTKQTTVIFSGVVNSVAWRVAEPSPRTEGT
jgi:hypothetical protein